MQKRLRPEMFCEGVSLKFLQNSQENTCVGVSGLQLY